MFFIPLSPPSKFHFFTELLDPLYFRAWWGINNVMICAGVKYFVRGVYNSLVLRLAGFL